MTKQVFKPVVPFCSGLTYFPDAIPDGCFAFGQNFLTKNSALVGYLWGGMFVTKTCHNLSLHYKYSRVIIVCQEALTEYRLNVKRALFLSLFCVFIVNKLPDNKFKQVKLR